MQELFPLNEAYQRPPAADELEISVIGPGFGECVLIHLGDNQWIVVDSCWSGSVREPAPLRYLSDLGISPERVSHVVVSHWDDDHCKGIAEVVRACKVANVIMSSAFIHKDFLAFVAAYRSPLTANARSGVKEIKETTEEISQTGRQIVLASPARRIFSEKMTFGLTAEFWTLSPSDYEHTNFLLWAAEQMPSVGETRRVAAKRIRNDLSVALHVSVGDDAILLGGDLEEEGNPLTGWSAVLSLGGKPNTPAKIFKVPHHGSETGHHDEVPSKMLAEGPISIVAPFKNGSVSLPKSPDIERINEFSSQAYATTTLKGRASPRLDRTVEKTVDQVTHRFSTIKSDPGLVRLRKTAGTQADWHVERFGNAALLSDIY